MTDGASTANAPVATSGGANRRDLRRVVGGLLRGQVLLPTTAEGAEILGALAVIGMRLINLAQLAIALPSSAADARNAGVCFALAALYFGQGGYSVVAVARARTARLPRLVTADVAVGCVVLLGQLAYSSPETRFSTWDAWGFGVTMSTALWAAIGYVGWRPSLLAGAALTVAYLVSVLPSSLAVGHPTTVSTNATAYLLNVVVARYIAAFLRRMARDADSARRQEAEAAARAASFAEREQHRDDLHDVGAMLLSISSGDDHPALRRAHREQALVLLRSITAILADGRDTSVTNETLGGVLRNAARGFEELDLTVNAYLVDDVRVEEDLAIALRNAVRTLLSNVREHAGPGAAVTVHGSVGESDGRWEVVVRDDGVGFDPGTTTLGRGLGTIVTATRLSRWDVEVRVEAAPWLGTAVTMAGHLRQRDAA